MTESARAASASSSCGGGGEIVLSLESGPKERACIYYVRKRRLLRVRVRFFFFARSSMFALKILTRRCCVWRFAPLPYPLSQVRGVPAPATATTTATTTTQYARRLPVPTASPKGPSDSCRVVGVSPRAQLDAAESRAASGMAAAAVLASARGCDRGPQPLQGSTTPEASRRVQRALLKLELPDWFRQHYRPPRRDPWLGDDGAAAQWPKWRALPGKDAKQPAGLRPSQVRSRCSSRLCMSA